MIIFCTFDQPFLFFCMSISEYEDSSVPLRGDVTDIKNSPAFVFLDELLQQGKLTVLQY